MRRTPTLYSLQATKEGVVAAAFPQLVTSYLTQAICYIVYKPTLSVDVTVNIYIYILDTHTLECFTSGSKYIFE